MREHCTAALGFQVSPGRAQAYLLACYLVCNLCMQDPSVFLSENLDKMREHSSVKMVCDRAATITAPFVHCCVVTKLPFRLLRAQEANLLD